jgi:uncharacterized repeat protein (TIGR03809 family)
MTQRFGIAFSRDFAARGRALAERRLAYLTELYDSGRWRRFHGEVDFLLNVREAKAAVDRWCRLEQFDPADGRKAGPSPVHAGANSPLVPLEAAPEAEVDSTIMLLESFIGQGGPIKQASPSWPDLRPARPSLLPPVLFSTEGVGAERDLSEA